MKCIILVAGKGNRLLPITENIPKSLVPINGVPIIDRIFGSLPDEIGEIILVVKYLKEKIESYAGNNFYGRKVSFVEQIDEKGTFSAILSAKELLDSDERFLVINGDDIHDKKELGSYLKYPRAFGLQKMNMPGYYDIRCDKDGYVKEFYKPANTDINKKVFVATGAYVIDTNIFKHEGVLLRDGEYGLPQTLLAQKDEYPIKGVVTTKWIPVNSFADIEKAEKILKQKHG